MPQPGDWATDLVGQLAAQKYNEREQAELIAKNEELAQTAASLRQRLEEAQLKSAKADAATLQIVRERDHAKAQLAQAQQERDAEYLNGYDAGGEAKYERMEERAEQAEAALEELHKQIEILKAANELLYDWLQKSMRGELHERPLEEALAELQRRRSPTGQETT